MTHDNDTSIAAALPTGVKINFQRDQPRHRWHTWLRKETDICSIQKYLLPTASFTSTSCQIAWKAFFVKHKKVEQKGGGNTLLSQLNTSAVLVTLLQDISTEFTWMTENVSTTTTKYTTNCLFLLGYSSQLSCSERIVQDLRRSLSNKKIWNLQIEIPPPRRISVTECIFASDKKVIFFHERLLPFPTLKNLCLKDDKL